MSSLPVPWSLDGGAGLRRGVKPLLPQLLHTAKDNQTGSDFPVERGGEEERRGGERTNLLSVSSIDYSSFVFFSGRWSLVLLLHSLSLL